MTEEIKADAFEAALAANATEIATPVVEEEIVEAPVASTEPELARSHQMKMATSNQMRMIQTQNSVARCAQHLATGM